MCPRIVSSILTITGLLGLLPMVNWAQEWQPRRLGNDTLEITAFWEPLTDAVYGFDKIPAIRDLSVAERQKVWRSLDFQSFLPTQVVKPGDVWSVDPNLVVPLLRQFHPGATADLHHGAVSAPGGWAMLTALDQAFAEIRFRIHAEFLLDGDGSFPDSSWFTPAQFQGRLIVDRGANRISGFQMGVPNQSANVDLNLPHGADIGRVPKMELAGGHFPEFDAQIARITEPEASNRLNRQFYPFAQVDWLSLPEARAQSLKSGKPLHVIALFGSLSDESC